MWDTMGKPERRHSLGSLRDSFTATDWLWRTLFDVVTSERNSCHLRSVCCYPGLPFGGCNDDEWGSVPLPLPPLAPTILSPVLYYCVVCTM